MAKLVDENGHGSKEGLEGTPRRARIGSVRAIPDHQGGGEHAACEAGAGIRRSEETARGKHEAIRSGSESEKWKALFGGRNGGLGGAIVKIADAGESGFATLKTLPGGLSQT